MVPLQGLLKPKNAYLWTQEHEEAMEKVKNILTSEKGPVLMHFDSKLPVVLITDASKTGLGFILAQDDGYGGHTRLIQCGSRFLTRAEKDAIRFHAPARAFANGDDAFTLTQRRDGTRDAQW